MPLHPNFYDDKASWGGTATRAIVCGCADDAKDQRELWASRGYKARMLQRDIRAGGVRIVTWCVIVRES